MCEGKVGAYVDSGGIEGAFSADGGASVDGHLRVVAPNHQTFAIVGNGEADGQQEADAAGPRQQSVQERAGSQDDLLQGRGGGGY